MLTRIKHASRQVITHTAEPGPVHRWFQFKESFSPALVYAILDRLGAGPGDRFLDPFCGAGTALLVAAERGLKPVGCDRSPLATFVSRVKLTPFSPAQVRQATREILQKGNLSTELPSGVRCPWFFSPTVYAQLLELRERILALDGPAKDVLLLGLIATVDAVDLAFKDGAFLAKIYPPKPGSDGRRKRQELFARERATPCNDVLGTWQCRMAAITHDLTWRQTMEALGVIRSVRQAPVLLADARQLPYSAKFDFIITSPPYPNRYDYTRIYEPELLILLGGRQTIPSLRHGMLCSNCEAHALPPHPYYREPARLTILLNRLQGRVDNKVIAMLRGYFSDMYHALISMAGALKPGGSLAMVVGTSGYDGLIIPTDELLAEIGEQAHLPIQTLQVLRRKDAPPQQRRHGWRQQRESLLLYQKPI